MPEPRLEEVFKLSGVPTFTFVKPVEYMKLVVALRTPGRGVVIEGPSGIGKTSAVTRALEELGLASHTLKLSARKQEDREFIDCLPREDNAGTVIIDDFHRLDESVRRALADFLKTLADEERSDTKLIIIGINKAGDSLISFSRDLAYRIDTIPFEANPDERVLELVEKGEAALKIKIDTSNSQLIAHEEAIFSRFPRFFLLQNTRLAWILLIEKTFLPFDHRDGSSRGLNRRKVHVWQGGQDSTHGKAVPSSAARFVVQQQHPSGCSSG